MKCPTIPTEFGSSGAFAASGAFQILVGLNSKGVDGDGVVVGGDGVVVGGVGVVVGGEGVVVGGAGVVVGGECVIVGVVGVEGVGTDGLGGRAVVCLVEPAGTACTRT